MLGNMTNPAEVIYQNCFHTQNDTSFSLGPLHFIKIMSSSEGTTNI